MNVRHLTCILLLAVARALVLASPAAAADRAPTGTAVLEAAGVHAGLCVYIGPHARLPAELARAGRFLVHQLVTDDRSLEAARAALRSEKLYGRVSVERLPLEPLPYAARAVNLLIVADLRAARAAGLSLKEVVRVLVPDGAALVGPPSTGSEEELAAQLKKAGVQGRAVLRKSGPWLCVRKRPVDGLAEWSHADGIGAGTWVSRDRVVGPPASLQWIDRPAMYMTHYSRPAAWVSGGGRVFYVYDERHPRMTAPSRLRLVARDAYNGKLLWRKPIYVPINRKRRWSFRAGALVVDGDRLYAPTGKNEGLQALNAETGEVLVDFKRRIRLVRVVNGALLASEVILDRLDPDTGKVLWTVKSPAPCYRMVVAEDRVFIQGKRRDKKTRRYEDGIACIDIHDGKERWWRPVAQPLRCYHAGNVISATKLKLNNAGDQQVVALHAETGEIAWSHTYRANGRAGFYPIGDRVWLLGAGLSWDSIDVVTGKPARTLDTYVKGSITHHFIRCAGTNATARYLITGNTMDFLDVQTGRHLRSSAARASCTFGLRTANGMVYAFPVDCGCFKSLRGVLGLSPEEPARAPKAHPSLIRGPAYSKLLAARSPSATPHASWPCYRHDPARTGASTDRIPTELQEVWRARIGGSPTAPTVGSGLVFAASKDRCELAALDAKTGTARWRFTTGGPLDTPPTSHDGAVYFGCRDGWVYCLRARDGALAWRYRVAPSERRIIAFGRIESPVPVYGTVVVLNKTVYCSAGRSSELDGGIQVCALDATSGRLLWRSGVPRSVMTGQQKLDRRRLAEQGALGDLLRSDGQYVYMRGWRFDLKTGAKKYYYNWKTGLRPNTKTGFLDATMKRPWTHRGVGGQMLVSSKTTTCGFTALKKEGWKLAYFTAPGAGEYRIFARHFGEHGKPDKASPGWAIEKAPIAVEAMAIAGDTLCVVGPPDAVEPEGGLLWAVSLADGKKLAAVRLDAPPVFDGLAAAGGRLYLSMQDGTVRCFAKK